MLCTCILPALTTAQDTVASLATVLQVGVAEIVPNKNGTTGRIIALPTALCLLFEVLLEMDLECAAGLRVCFCLPS